jgi:ATP-dependent DNA helicase RecQ
MEILIVAKTRQGSGACIGGLTFEGRSVRLIAANAATNERAGVEYEVGEVWDVDAAAAEHVIPPHVENIIVSAKRRLGTMPGCVSFIEQRMPPKIGGPELLFEGLTQTVSHSALYIAERAGVPPFSTTFWRPDQPLTRVDDGKRIRYHYPTPDGGCTLVFVGFQEPVELIPAGTLLRVSLAHWWRRPDATDSELRCYVQLSGWFLPQTAPPRPAPEPAEQSSEPDAGSGAEIIDVHSWADPAASTLDAAHRILKSVFGYDTFRPLQAEIIANVLAGRDALVVMPTGGGKSLCYQLPALLADGLTVVISPLISLMQDQVMQLRELGVPAAFLNSTVEYADYLATAKQVRAGKIKLLYTSPETLLRPETLVLLDRSRVRFLAIDEAHCISEWGHDFRPEYRQLLTVRERYRSAACIALTATATERVRRDIQQRLGFRDESAFIASFDRPNLFLETRPRLNGLEQLLAFLANRRDQSGIIYCSTRDGVDRLAGQLSAAGWSVLPYHAGLEDATRRRNQELFSRDRTPIIVATIAFGMGINKSNVRFVVHFNLPKDIESYYQEIGRAGRDGLHADCLLLYSRSDMQTIYRFIEEGAATERAGRHARLQAMSRYAEAVGCRRVQLLAYFGQESQPCGFCDNCLAARIETAQVDVTDSAQKFLGTVHRTGEIFGSSHIIDVLCGSRSQRVLRYHHDRLPTYDAGKEHSPTEWRHLAEAFIRQGLLEQDMEHGSLRLTAQGRAVFDGARVMVPVEERRPEVQAAAEGAAQAAHDPALFELLRALRRELADAADLPPYVVFSDRSLVEMATYYPQSPQRLLDMHGVGQRKLTAYGDRFLEVIRTYCSGKGYAERVKRGEASARQHTLTNPDEERRPRWREVGEAFAAGQTVEELMALYNVKQSTVAAHLGQYIRSGGTLDPARILAMSKLSKEEQERVLKLMTELGPERLSPIFEVLGGAISYEALHVMRTYYSSASQGLPGQTAINQRDTRDSSPA